MTISHPSDLPPEPLHRKSIRLKGYDYSLPGAYFVTACTVNRQSLFGRVENGIMELNQFGRIVEEEWLRLPERFPSVAIDEFIVMPNHFHGILQLLEQNLANREHSSSEVGAGFTPAQNCQSQGLLCNGQPQGLPLLGHVIGAFKSLCVKGCLDISRARNEILGKVWQRNYYEYIIRDEDEFHKIILYIQSNPARWDEDQYHP